MSDECASVLNHIQFFFSPKMDVMNSLGFSRLISLNPLLNTVPRSVSSLADRLLLNVFIIYFFLNFLKT